MKDRVYASPHGQLVDFAFDEGVASVFPDMIRRSVPGYELVVPMTGLMAAEHLNAGDHAYDLGCSLGASTLATLARLGEKPVRITAVDNAPAMLARAAEHLRDPRVQLVEADVRSLAYEPARVVLSNWLLQFVPPDERAPLLQRICQALQPGGCLLLSEKVRFEDAETQRDFESIHHAFKRANGYSELEVSQKRSALENVMIPDTEAQHIERLEAAGFTTIRVWYRCLNWLSIVAYA
jgi:tRNA (cmo5U34)-methyltransferase